MTALARRVRTMTAAEIRFRIVQRARAAIEASRVTIGVERWDRDRLFPTLSATSPELAEADRASRSRQWKEVNSALRHHFLKRQPRFPLEPASRGELSGTIRDRYPDAVSHAVRRAEACIGGRYDVLGFFGLRFDTKTARPDWHFDPVHNRRTPPVFWTRMPYLDPAIGDHKI